MKTFSSKLRQRITIEEPVYTSDLLGGFITAWNAYAILWAEVVPVQRQENISAEKKANSVTYRITTRFVPDVKANMRVLYKGKHYSVRSVVNVNERNEMLEIIVSNEVK